MRLQLLLSVLIVFSPYTLAMEDYSFPAAIDKKGFYVFYSHGYILKNTDLNFVILAACTSGLAKNEEVVIYGHLFSIYETSDSVSSCDEVVARSGKNVSSYKEISISTGKEHGAFYQPLNEWLLPVKNWQKRLIKK